MIGVLARKIGMTRVFDKAGRARPATAVLVVPGEVLQVKPKEKDGYRSIKIGVGPKEVEKPQKDKSRIRYQKIREFKVEGDSFKAGDKIGIEFLKEGNLVKITGISKGKGFSGVIKRHGFRRGPETHGSDHHRAPGAIGSMFPQRVLKGKKMPGRKGGETVTLRKQPILRVLKDKNLVLIEGSLPGPNRGWLKIEKEV